MKELFRHRLDICLRMHGSLVINDLLDERLASGFLLEAGVALGAVHFDFSLAAFEAHQALAARAAEILVFPAHFQTEQEGLEIETGFPGPCGILAVFLSTLGVILGEDTEERVDFAGVPKKDQKQGAKETAGERDQNAG